VLKGGISASNGRPVSGTIDQYAAPCVWLEVSVVSGGGTVFWHTVGSWNNRPAWFPSGSGWFLFFLVSRAWPKPHELHPRGGCSGGGGCDGVVVWELYSGREHLVKQDR